MIVDLSLIGPVTLVTPVMIQCINSKVILASFIGSEKNPGIATVTVCGAGGIGIIEFWSNGGKWFKYETTLSLPFVWRRLTRRGRYTECSMVRVIVLVDDGVIVSGI